MARIHFIVNPLRPSIGLRWPYEEKKIATLTQDFKVHLIRGKLHAEILTREAMESGAKLIVCVGGDSTLSEIANGLYRASQGGRPIPELAVYAGLQKGDFVRSLKLRDSFLEFLHLYLEGQAICEPLDLGEVEFTGDYGQKVRRRFINCSAFGFSSILLNKLRKDNRIAQSRFTFLRAMIGLLPFFRHPELTVVADGVQIYDNKEILTGIIHNGRYGGHGFDISPVSEINDGHLEYTLVSKTFTFNYLMAIFPLFAGRLKSLSFVRYARCSQLKVISTQTSKKVRIDYDGDSWGFLPAEFRILEKALTITR